MKKTLKLITTTLIILILATTAFMLTACRGGADTPERAAENLINALSRQSSRRIANVLGLEDEERDEFIERWEEKNAAPDANAPRAERDKFRHRQDEFRSLNFINFVGRTVAATENDASGTATFSFRQINHLGDTATLERSVLLNFIRGESGRWYSAETNITAIEGAMGR